MKSVWTASQKYREQAHACRDKAAFAPTDELRRHWFTLAENYEQAADAMLPGQPSRLFSRRAS